MKIQRFTDQVVVITGGASGIGYAAARQMAAEGAKIAIWSRSNAGEKARELGTDAIGLSVDVTDENSVKLALNETIAKYGKIDALVASAGIAGPYAPVQKYSLDEWKNTLDAHLNGTFLSCRAVIEPMLERNQGRIVTISSVAGKTGVPNAAAYATAKAGIIAFTKSLALELAKTNIRVNTLAPGVIETPIITPLPIETKERMLSIIPQGRFGTPEECAAMIVFMASEECSFNTGSIFDISGGMSPY